MIIMVILLLQAANSTPPPQLEMTTGGWLFMGGAWAGILTLVYFTFSKVLGGARKK